MNVIEPATTKLISSSGIPVQNGEEETNILLRCSSVSSQPSKVIWSFKSKLVDAHWSRSTELGHTQDQHASSVIQLKTGWRKIDQVNLWLTDSQLYISDRFVEHLLKTIHRKYALSEYRACRNMNYTHDAAVIGLAQLIHIKKLEGMYNCAVKNKLGQISSKVNLIGKCKFIH